MSGYTAGAGIHLLVSQLKTILGIDLPRENGYDDKGELKVFKVRESIYCTTVYFITAKTYTFVQIKKISFYSLGK